MSCAAKYERKIPEGQEDVVGESYVAYWLALRGFRVYRAMSAHSQPDLVTYRPGNQSIRRIEVTTAKGSKHRGSKAHWDYRAVVTVDRRTLKVSDIRFYDRLDRDVTRRFQAGHGWRQK